ncbi:MAG: hypothetical protein LBL90_13095 [Prevotellaceae bacterium]|jgi:IS1 family transposase|nr:hypothetical protein [Prevotellaceae bacterium]
MIGIASWQYSEAETIRIGKKYTVGIEGNNRRLKHRIRRVFHKTFCFSKNLFNHLKAVNPAFFYVNFDFVYLASGQPH